MSDACGEAPCSSTMASYHDALVRVICRRVHVSGTARALAACLYQYMQQPHNEDDRMWTVSVEAVGSGTVLIPALQLDPASTVGALRARISDVKNKAAVRLFVGHGGPELTEAAETCVSDSSLSDGATVVVVVVAGPCYSCGYPYGTQLCTCGVPNCDVCALKCSQCGHDACENCVEVCNEPCREWTCPKCGNEEHEC
jgi:hypothetical protein